jgi:hypothetical protein
MTLFHLLWATGKQFKAPCNGWLTDNISSTAQTSLHKHCGISGFQGTEIGQTCGFIVEPEEFIQLELSITDRISGTISTIGTEHPQA